MIARLRGKVIEAYPNRLVVDVHGVGYEVIIPISTFDRLHAAEGVEVDLRTHLHIRETAHTLYGFASEEERDVFLMLIDRVSGIGPAIAMAVLSGMPVSRFKSCVVAGNAAELSRIKGLGKKTAERIVLELKDKVGVTDTWQDAAAGDGQRRPRRMPSWRSSRSATSRWTPAKPCARCWRRIPPPPRRPWCAGRCGRCRADGSIEPGSSSVACDVRCDILHLAPMANQQRQTSRGFCVGDRRPVPTDPESNLDHHHVFRLRE